MNGLTDKQFAFAREYPKDWNATKAAERAGYSERSAHVMGCELLKYPNVQVAIEEQKDCLAAMSAVTVEMIVCELYKVATADRRGCCRFCWGVEHKYQWTEKEYAKALESTGSVPDPQGLFGYTKRRPANPECPVCAGEGLALSRLDVKPQDKMKALEMLGRYKSMFVERKELVGPGGGPLALTAVRAEDMTDDQLAAIIFAAHRPANLRSRKSVNLGALLGASWQATKITHVLSVVCESLDSIEGRSRFGRLAGGGNPPFSSGASVFLQRQENSCRTRREGNYRTSVPLRGD